MRPHGIAGPPAGPDSRTGVVIGTQLGRAVLVLGRELHGVGVAHGAHARGGPGTGHPGTDVVVGAGYGPGGADPWRRAAVQGRAPAARARAPGVGARGADSAAATSAGVTVGRALGDGGGRCG